ncbi:MAG: 16S rRNA (cytidine(1402)-2'-O)-methyltransferase [Gammaproteobacteria bacterium]|nr:16S rRNA (cytidine(1402)-2'-O)-methyltransferase [Gammaproteobacteria bacterium]
MSTQKPALHVVATPIGNLGDITARARDILASVDIVLCEDTRHSGRLLAELGIKAELRSLHDHNERQRIEQVLGDLDGGKSLALISDAGTPLISDPGFALVRALRDAGHDVVPVPGPSAVISALSAAGLPTDRFSFEGFLPGKSGQRRKVLAALASDPRTLVFYESPRRIHACLDDLATEFGPDRRVVIARELTKLHEEFIVGSVADLQASLAGRELKGECVLMLAGNDSESSGIGLDADTLLKALLEELPASKAAKLAARLTGESRQELYARASTLAGKS